MRTILRPSLLLIVWLAVNSLPAWGHSMYQAAVLLDFHGAAADAELQLPLDRLQLALNTQLLQRDFESGRSRVTEYIVRHFTSTLRDGRRMRIDPIDLPHLSKIEGAPFVVARFRLVPPSGSEPDLFDLHCSFLLDSAPSQVILVSIRTDWRTSTFANEPQLLGVLRGSDRDVRIDRRNGTWWRGFGSVFNLGMHHIADGTDHLLFLLALLLPAPLVALHGRWSRLSDTRRCLVQIGKVVTAFTVGHSITLACGVLNLVHVPTRPVETLVAVSILVSAVHAIRPMFPGRETVVAGCFGLVHGLAFATTLAELGLSRWERVVSIFGFNLGIESMQLVVVVAALPSLILLSRTSLYSSIRTAGTLFAGAAASGWIAQRLWDIPNPADAFVTAIAQRAVWIALGLAVLGIIARSSTVLRGHVISRS